MAGIIGDSYFDLVSNFIDLRGRQYRSVLEHIPSPLDTGKHRRFVDLIRIHRRQQAGKPGASTGYIMQRQVVTDRWIHITPLAGYIPHMTILTSCHKGLVAAKFGGINTFRRIISTVQPLAVGPFDRQQGVSREIGRRRIECIRRIAAAAIFFKRRITDIVAGTAQSRFTVERRDQYRMATVGSDKRTAAGTGWIDCIHAIAKLKCWE